MLSFLLDKDFLKVNKVQGLHCILRSEGDMKFFYASVVRHKGKIEIEKCFTMQGSIDEVEGTLIKDVPIFLSIEGRGVLSKKVVLNSDKSLIHQVIPNANEDEFIIQPYGGNGNSMFVSLARKDSVDELLDKFMQHKYKVLGLSLGPFSTVRLFNIFDNLPSDLHVGHYLISVDKANNQVIDFKRQEDDREDYYLVGGTSLSSDYVMPLFNTLSYYMTDVEKLQYPAVSVQMEEFTSKRLFLFAGWAALIIIFVILLGNMLAYSSYSQQEQQLEMQVTGGKELLNAVAKLNDDLAWKEKFLSQAGILKNTRMSYYADQIAISLPAFITLEEMEIHPVISKIKKQKEIELQPDKILIDGMANGSQLVNSWVEKLKTLSWIEDVSVINYSKDNEASAGVFSLEIKIRRE